MTNVPEKVVPDTEDVQAGEEIVTNPDDARRNIDEIEDAALEGKAL